jgi:hypothetical protein
MKTAVGIILAALALAACGSQQDSTKLAASCLQNALANDALSGPRNCADDIAYKVAMSGSGSKFSATCTHQDGNQYICDVTGPGTQPIDAGGLDTVRGGFYAITYDGKSIVYQPN